MHNGHNTHSKRNDKNKYCKTKQKLTEQVCKIYSTEMSCTVFKTKEEEKNNLCLILVKAVGAVCRLKGIHADTTHC